MEPRGFLCGTEGFWGLWEGDPKNIISSSVELFNKMPY